MAHTPPWESWVEPTRLPIALDWTERSRTSNWAKPVVDRVVNRLSISCGVVGYASDHPALDRSEADRLAPLGVGLESELIALMIEHAGAEASSEVSISHHPVHTLDGGYRPAASLAEACDTVGPGGVVLVLTQAWSEGRFVVATSHPRVVETVEYCVQKGVLIVASAGNEKGPADGDEEVAEASIGLELKGPLVVGALGHARSDFEPTRRTTPLWADPTVQIGDQTWVGTAAAAARVAGSAWRIQSEFMDREGEPLTPADLQRFLLASSYDEGTPDRVPNLQGALDRLGGLQETRSQNVAMLLGLVFGLVCFLVGTLLCVGFFLWMFRGLFSR